MSDHNNIDHSPEATMRKVLSKIDKNNITSRILCLLCNDIMLEPMQTICGCRYCSKCINQFIADKERLCPNCKDQSVNKFELIKDKAIEKEIMKIEIRCPNVDCKKTLLLKELSDHLLVCVFRNEQCVNCKQSYPYSKNLEHVTDHCSKGVIACKYCGIEMTREHLGDVHLNYDGNLDFICENWISLCPYKCVNETSINVKHHLSDCPNKPIHCPLKEIGCDVVLPRNSENSHAMEYVSLHQILMLNEIQRLQKENFDLNKCYCENEEIAKLENEKLRKLNSKNDVELERLTTKIDEMQQSIAKLASELERYKTESTSNNGANSATDIVSHNGYVTWTITDIRSKIRAAKSRSNECIVSDPFYVSRPGYRMTLKVYPNGDGHGRDSHLSAYFVINKGDYDNSLSWPFRAKVSLCLLSSRPSVTDLSVHMRPDDNESCYGRPSFEHNVGAGQPRFVELPEILDRDCFLHDGALKLRLAIEMDR